MDKKEITEKICNDIINISVWNRSGDNLSLIFICFDNFFNNKDNCEEIFKRVNFQDCESMII